VPVKVVLEVFNTDKTSYTDSLVDGQCYKAGPSCPEKHQVCKPEYCEMDLWKALIAGFKAASPGMVTVLGSVDATTTISAYEDLNLDGFYLVGTLAVDPPERTIDNIRRLRRLCECNGFCYDHYMDEDPAMADDWMCCGCDCPGCNSDGGGMYDDDPYMYDEWMYTDSPTPYPTHSPGTLINKGNIDWYANQQTLGACEGDCDKDSDCDAGLKCFQRSSEEEVPPGCHSGGAGDIGTHDYCYDPPPTPTPTPQPTASPTPMPTGLIPSGYATVAAIGNPLFDEAAVDQADVYVTLASSDLGLWNPFSWYPYVPPSKWAAIVTEATSVDAVATLLDRGYGWVYLTSEGGFDTKSTMTSDFLAAIEAFVNVRRMRGRRLEASEPFWGCDDTLMACEPICMRQTGPVTSKVSDKLCAGAPLDQCACQCYHSAQWTCDGSSVVCKAKYGAGELQTVGDKVCEMRGAPKPASTAELRVASECEPVTEMRGSAPTTSCLAQWGTPEPRSTEVPSEPIDHPFLYDSFAAPVAFAALALYA
jgi:hypothetical protein